MLFDLAFLAQTVRIAVPYALAATGGALSERAGVIYLALEGTLLVGAFGATAATLATGNPWVGVLAGIASGILFAALHAAVTVSGRADQILSGLALNLLAFGATRGMMRVFYGSSSNSPRFDGISPVFGSDAVLGVLGQPLLWLAVLAIFAAHRLLLRTRFGLTLRAAGDGPRALDARGVSVERTRWYGVLLAGAFGGFAGTWLALEQHSFTEGMSNGRGYIALAAMIVGKWRPLAGALACLLFGGVEALQIRVSSEVIPTQVLQMLPYVVTLIVLAGWIGRATAPRALGVPYDREEPESS